MAVFIILFDADLSRVVVGWDARTGEPVPIQASGSDLPDYEQAVRTVSDTIGIHTSQDWLRVGWVSADSVRHAVLTTACDLDGARLGVDYVLLPHGWRRYPPRLRTLIAASRLALMEPGIKTILAITDDATTAAVDME